MASQAKAVAPKPAGGRLARPLTTLADSHVQGPEPHDIFFGIVRRGAAMIMLKDVGVDPVPNYTRDIKRASPVGTLDLFVPDPDALAAEFVSREVEFFQPLGDGDDGLRGFEVKDADGYLLCFGRPVDEGLDL